MSALGSETWFYHGVRRLFLVLARPLFRIRVEGREQVPASGAGIVVASHRSWLDPACVGAAVSRPIRFLIMEKVYCNRWTNWFYRRMRGIPVPPSGHAALPALREALRALRRGEIVGIFPEGRVVRSGESVEAQGGVALLAVRSGAPVIPVRIRGSAQAWPHGSWLPRPAPVEVEIEPPFLPAPEASDAADQVMRRIRRVLAPGGIPRGDR